MSDNQLAKVTTSAITKPSVEEVAKNIKIVRDEMKKGITSPLDIYHSLKEQGYGWDRNKVIRYFKAALITIEEEGEQKKLLDQRHVLLLQSENVEQMQYREILKLIENRDSGLAKLARGTSVEDLPWEEQQAVTLEPNKYHSTISKAMLVALKAQERRSELYGYKQDKTIILKQEQSEDLKYMDDYNKDLVKRYRNLYDTHDIIDVEVVEVASDEESKNKGIIEELSNDGDEQPT